MRPAPITDAAEVRVIIPFRVSFRARDKLRAYATKKGLSLNEILMAAVEQYTGIDLP
jgi:hypothetical protein